MIDLNPNHLEIVERILADHVPGCEVRAFGSRAAWTARDYSDVDLAIVGNGPLHWRTLSRLREAFEESRLPMRVDVVDWHAIADGFRESIASDCVVVQEPETETGSVALSEASNSEENWLYRPKFPESWERRSLHSLAQWVNGLAFRNIEFSPTGKPIIKIAEIKGGISGQTKFTQQVFDESVRVRSGDLLFSWSGQPETSIDAFWWRGTDGWLNQHVFRVTANSDVDTTFFYYLLRHLKPNFVGIARNKQTTGLGHVTKRDLQSIDVAFPSLEEQRAIARVLGALDDKIELNRRMSETLEEMARALFRSWFVDFDPVRAKAEGRPSGLPPDLDALFPASFEASELGEIPAGWEVRTLGDVVRQLRANENPLKTPETMFSHFSIPAYDEGQMPKLELGASIKSVKTRIEPGTVLLSKLNPEIERVWLPDVAPDEAAICSTEFLVLDARPPFRRSYIYCLARSPAFRRQLESLVTGTSRSHQRAQANAVLALQTIIPPEAVIHEFDRQASPALDRTLRYRRDMTSLAAQRDALLPRLVSGDIRSSRLAGSSSARDVNAGS